MDPQILLQHYMEKQKDKMVVFLCYAEDGFEVIHANSQALGYFGGTLEVTAADFFADAWLIIQSTIQHASITGSHNVRCQLYNQQPTLFDVQVHIEKMDDERTVVLIEIEKNKKSERDFVEQSNWQHKYDLLLSQNFDAIITMSTDGTIQSTNPAMHTITGYFETDLLTQSIYEYIEREQVNELECLINRCKLGMICEPEDFDIKKSDNEYIPVSVKALPVFNKGQVAEIKLLIRDLSKYYEYDEKFLYLSNRNQLTGLLNRTALKKQFTKQLTMNRNREEQYAFIHLGIDRFKLLNEELGYATADELLRKIAYRLEDACPKMVQLYHSGGDEFVALLSSHTTEMTNNVANRLLQALDKPFFIQNQQYFISISVGISIYPTDGESVEKLLRKSEQAMFYVKEHGRGHFRYYTEEMESVLTNEVLLESHLRRAVELEELSVYYQPQFDLKTGTLQSFEALLRWNNRKFGFVPPDRFIRIAEDSGLIHSIGRWVLEQVCEQLKKWQKEGIHYAIAVNISAKQFRMDDFSEMIAEYISAYQLIPKQLELEITEGSLINMKDTLCTLQALKKIGVRISVDDFGTGYSSLSYLKQYPIDIIKIDRSFVMDLEKDLKNRAIAKTIINLAHNLGMEVIAEGVETVLQEKILIEAQCEKAQGYYYSRPIPIEEVEGKYGRLKTRSL